MNYHSEHNSGPCRQQKSRRNLLFPMIAGGICFSGAVFVAARLKHGKKHEKCEEENLFHV